MTGRGRNGRGRGATGRRTPRSWLARGSLALGFAVLGYFGTVASLAHGLARVDPASALSLSPDNAVIMADFAEKAFARAPNMDPRSLPGNLARRALLADPTAVSALTVLGIQAQLRGEVAQSNRIFSYSTALSRRELRPRIWAIEDAVARGDIAAALRHYDIALRTSKEANNLLFPTLAAALSEPRIRAELLPILASRPVWEKDFLPYLATSGIEPAGAIALFVEGQGIGLRATDEIRATFVKALTAQGNYEAAWAYYRSFRPGVRRDRSRDPEFMIRSEARTVFDWQEGDTRLAATIAREGERGSLQFNVPPSIGGKVVTQTQLLPPGTYELQGRSSELEQAPGSQPYWVLQCVGGAELGRVELPPSNRNGGLIAGRISVPPSCPVQELSLMIRPTDDVMGVAGRIDRAQLVRSQ